MSPRPQFVRPAVVDLAAAAHEPAEAARVVGFACAAVALAAYAAPASAADAASFLDPSGHPYQECHILGDQEAASWQVGTLAVAACPCPSCPALHPAACH